MTAMHRTGKHSIALGCLAWALNLAMHGTVGAQPPDKAVAPAVVEASRIPEVLTAEEVAKILRVSGEEVTTMAAREQIPGRLIAGQWRFHRSAVLAWLAGKDPVHAALEHGFPEQEKTADQSASSAPPSQSKVAPADPEAAPESRTAKLEPPPKEQPSSIETETASAQKQEPETIGEKPTQPDAEEVFLRDVGVLLQRGQVTLELGTIYNRNEQPVLIPSFPFVNLGTQKRETYSASFSARYGLRDNLQLFAAIPFLHFEDEVAFGSSKLVDTSDSEFGDLTLGLRQALFREGVGYPSVILSAQGSIPTRDNPYTLGASIAMTKSLDPAILFANIGYQHAFVGNIESRPRAENSVSATLGIAYALNDTLTLSTALDAAFTGRTTFDRLTLLSNERYNLRFGLTSYLAKGLYIEPSVSFGLTGPGSEVTIGINLPYTFD